MATPHIIGEALKNATPAQIIRVRGLISRRARREAMADLDPLGWKCNRALEAFDKGKYSDPYIADVLNDTELGEALR